MEIYCFNCEVEILDENITRQFTCKDKHIVKFKEKILTMIQEHFLISNGKQVFSSEATFKLTGLQLLSTNNLTNAFSTVMYTLWSIPYLRYVIISLSIDPQKSIHYRARVLAKAWFPADLFVAKDKIETCIQVEPSDLLHGRS